MLRKGHSRYKLLREVDTNYLCLFLLIWLNGREKHNLVGKRFFLYSAIVVNKQCTLEVFFVML